MEATKCPSTDKLIKKMSHTHTHTHEYSVHTHTHMNIQFSSVTQSCPTLRPHYSVIKNENLPFPTWMDQEGIMLSKISQTKTNTIGYYLYMKSKK